MSLRDFSQEIEFLKQSPQITSIEECFINNENLFMLSGTESAYEIIQAFLKDLKKNVNLIVAITQLKQSPNNLQDVYDIEIQNYPIFNAKDFDYLVGYKNEKNIVLTASRLLAKSYFQKFNKPLNELNEQEQKEQEIFEKEMGNILEGYCTSKNLKLIYDSSDVFEFLKYTKYRIQTDKLAEQILQGKTRKLHVWEQNHTFSTYQNIYNKKVATVYMEKKDSLILHKNSDTNLFEITLNPKNLKVSKELLDALNNSSHIHALEVDCDTNIEQLTKLIEEINTFNLNIDKTFYFKIRKLGKHQAAGLYYQSFDIVAVDIDEDYAAAHEITHHIHLNHGISTELEIAMCSFNKYNDYSKVPQSKVDYYNSTAEIVARVGEVSFSLYKADFYNLFMAYKNKTLYKEQIVNEDNFFHLLIDNSTRSNLSLSLEDYMKSGNKEVYFDLETMSIENMHKMYTCFQNIFQYEHSLLPMTNYTKEDKRLHFEQISKQSVKKRRNYRILKGISSYDSKIVDEILNQYNLGNIKAMSKEEFVVEILTSNFFQYKTKTIKNLFNNENSLVSIEEKDNIMDQLITLILEEGINEKNLILIHAILDYIPIEYYELLNIIDVNTLKNKTPQEIKFYLGALLDNKTIIKKPNFDNTNVTEIFDYLETLYILQQNYPILLKEGTSIETQHMSFNSTNGVLHIEGQKNINDIHEPLIINDNKNNKIYIPINDSQALEANKNTNNNYSYYASSNSNYIPTLSEEEKKQEVVVKTLIKGQHSYELPTFSLRNSPKVEHVFIPNSNISIFLNNPTNVNISWDTTVSNAPKPIINSMPLEDFIYTSSIGNDEGSIKSYYHINEQDEMVKKYTKNKLFFDFKEYILQSNTLKRGLNSINSEQITLLMSYFDDEKDFDMFINSLDKLEFNNFSQIDFLKYVVIPFVYNKWGVEKVVSFYLSFTSQLLVNMSKTLESYGHTRMFEMLEGLNYAPMEDKIKIEQMISMINAFIINTPIEKFEELALSQEEFNTIKGILITIDKKMYEQIFKKEINENIIDYIESLWRTNSLQVSNKEKLSSNEIVQMLSKYEFKHIMNTHYSPMETLLNQAKSKVVDKLSQTKAQKSISDLKNEFLDAIRFELNPHYSVYDNYNIFDFSDGEGNRKGVLTQENQKKISMIDKETLKKVLNIVQLYNKQNRIQTSYVHTYEDGFGYLEIGLLEAINFNNSQVIKSKSSSKTKQQL